MPAENTCDVILQLFQKESIIIYFSLTPKKIVCSENSRRLHNISKDFRFGSERLHGPF